MVRKGKALQSGTRRLTSKETEDYKKALNEVIDSIPDELKPRVLTEYYRLLKVLASASPYICSSKQTILDVGCGMGILSLVLQKKEHDVTAVDCWKNFPQTHVYYAETRVNRERLEGQGIHTEDLDIAEESLPFEENKFDLVLFLDVIEHLHNSPKQPLKEIKRVLKPQGILVLTTANVATLKNRLSLLFGKSNYSKLAYWYNATFFDSHLREYTLDELKRMLSWESFDVKVAKFLSDWHILKVGKLESKPRLLIRLLYLLVTAIVVPFRYEMIVVAQSLRVAGSSEDYENIDGNLC